MHGPDRTDYQEWISWTEIAPPERIALVHGESRSDPNAFESVVTFEAAIGLVHRLPARLRQARNCPCARGQPVPHPPAPSAAFGATAALRLKQGIRR